MSSTEMKVDTTATRRGRSAEKSSAEDSSGAGSPNPVRHKGEPNINEILAKFTAEVSAANAVLLAASDDKFARLFGMLNTKIDDSAAAITTLNSKVDASAAATALQVGSLKDSLSDQAEKIASLMSRASESDAASSSGWPPAGSASSAPAARPHRFPHFGKGVPLHPLGPRPAHDHGDDGRFKIFFTEFPRKIAKLVLNSWIDRIYEKTDKEPGFQKHIGHNNAFSISFPDKEGGFRFMKQVTDDKISLIFTYKTGECPIVMKPMRRTSRYGKALSSAWKVVKDHLDSESSIDHPITIDQNTNSGHLYALFDDEVLTLFSISGEKLVPDEANLASLNFPTSLIAKVIENFVA
jgi:hypothetical protein